MESQKEKRDQIFIAFIIVGVVAVVLSNAISGNGTGTIFANTFIFILIMYALFYVAPYCFRKIKEWRSTPKPKNIKLEKETLDDGKTAFFILNKEFRKSKLFISRIQIADNSLTWFPISTTSLSLKTNDTEKIFFLTWDKQHRYFYFSDFGDHPYRKVFGVGVYKFDIVITYGFNEKGNDLIKRYSTIVSLEEDGVIRVLEIKHSNSER